MDLAGFERAPSSVARQGKTIAKQLIRQPTDKGATCGSAEVVVCLCELGALCGFA
jgi:hypothetical protein